VIITSALFRLKFIAVLLINVANHRIPSPKDSWEENEIKASRQFWS